MIRKLSVIFSIALLGLAFTACGGGFNESASNFDYTTAPQAVAGGAFNDEAWSYGGGLMMEAEEAAGLFAIETSFQSQRMLIQQAYLELAAAADDFDNTVENLRNIAVMYDGFVEHSGLSANEWWSNGERHTQRSFTITLRVPVQDFQSALNYAESLGRVAFSSQSADDVTGQFYDMAGRLETRQIEEARLLELIEETNRINIRDLLVLEERLAQIRTQIEIYRIRMSNMADQAAFSTIIVNLSEETDNIIYANEGFLTRIGEAFTSSAGGTGAALQSIAVFLAAAIIPLSTAGVLALVTWKIVSSVLSRKKLENKIPE